MAQLTSGKVKRESGTNVYLDVLRGDIYLNPDGEPKYFINECLDDIALEDSFGDIPNSEHRQHARLVLTRLLSVSS